MRQLIESKKSLQESESKSNSNSNIKILDKLDIIYKSKINLKYNESIHESKDESGITYQFTDKR
jgi:hypothetical protein